MEPDRIDELSAVYRDGLFNDTLPFWINHSVDTLHGGFMFCLDRDGTVIDTDKGIWQQGRFTWLLATLYNTVQKRDQWLELAAHGVDFIRRHGFDDDGRMFFITTRDGRPLRKRRYVFTEVFAAIALAAFSKASGDRSAASFSPRNPLWHHAGADRAESRSPHPAGQKHGPSDDALVHRANIAGNHRR